MFRSLLCLSLALTIVRVSAYPSTQGDGICPITKQQHAERPSSLSHSHPHIPLSSLAFLGVTDSFGAGSDVVQPEITNKGCTCKTTCGASASEGLYNCDWCYTENNCGRSSLSGYWDYCNYLLNTTYEAQSASDKYSYLWSRITASNTSGTYPNVLGIFTESVQTSFGNQRDWMPDGRIKYIHAVGVICPVNFTISSTSNYTGLFAPNEVSIGFVRLGPAIAVDPTSGLTPGLGLKFLRSGVPSGNFVALHSLDPLPNQNYDFFNATFSNQLPTPNGAAAKLLEPKFAQASECPQQVGLSDFASFDSLGRAVPASSLNFPFRLDLDSHVYHISSSPRTQAEVVNDITKIPVGTPLFTVTAYADPKSYASAQGTFLGTMTTTETCTTSAWGDSAFFIQHQGIESDWQLRPEWIPQIDAQSACNIAKITLPGPAFCSSL